MSNNVRGPTSALTEFLRDSGITPTTIAARAATRQRNDDQQISGPSTARTTQATTNRRRRSTRTTGYASDNLDEPEEANGMDIDGGEKVDNPSKKRKLTKAAEAKLKAKEKKKMDKKGSDDDYEEDAYTALSKSHWASNTQKPTIGNFEICATCEKQFTVTKYTMASSTGDGFLCHKCAKAGGNDPFKPAVPRKRKAPQEKRKITSFPGRRFPTLVSLCVQLISDHINDVEALGDIGTVNLEAVAKALSKNRSLTPENAHLFYSPANTTLTLFDATNLNSSALGTLAYHNANLVSLRLEFCGQLTDESLKVWTTALPVLTRLELLGPFLVHPRAWQDFFKAHPKLDGFLITQSHRFDVTCMKSLVDYCPGLKELQLCGIGKMNDDFLHEIAKLRQLWFLDLSDPNKSCGEDAMLDLMSAIGKNLTCLSLSKHNLLTDTFLTKGLKLCTGHLKSLTLSHLPGLTDAVVAKFFDSWKNPPLLALNMSGNVELASTALEAILKHSGRCLEHLDINGWKGVGNDELLLLGRTCAELKKLDVGWCRAVDDFVLKAWLEGEIVQGIVIGGCKRLQELKVWGCNKVSVACSRRPGVEIMGAESHMIV